MRRIPLALPAALTGALLLTACGTQRADSQSLGSSPAQGSASCSDQATPGSSALPGNSSGPGTDGVRLVGGADCPAFEVTNDAGETATYTITFQLMSNGAAMASAKQTLPPVTPGQTVRQAVDRGGMPTRADDGTQVRILTVRSVPTAEAPSKGGPCPPSGVRMYADDGDAAMGLRVVGLHLVNCGTRDYRLDGYPQLQLLDERHQRVDGVRILHGGDSIATGTGADGPPRPMVLRPGESAQAGLVWRNITGTESDPVNVPYVRVVAKPGAAAVMVTPELDLGTTGKLGIGPWQKDATSRPSPTPSPATSS
ncbi:DUF4232 domain-containing protein [Peterkaempfera sp. SMS 1(5)a]|uniref:DUF4232 domain-containing protein n=1 Tax=Peterkaempfera podocarpi TaxID=3232308 RepID=UPI00366DAF0B